MRKSLVLGTVVSIGYLAIAASQDTQPLKAETGLWQMTETIVWSQGMPGMPSERTHNYKSCVKAEDLRTNPWAQGSSAQCQWTVVTSTATDMDVKGTGCQLGMQGMTAEVHGTIHLADTKNGTGSFDITVSGNGQPMKGHVAYTGKWAGATCPAE